MDFEYLEYEKNNDKQINKQWRKCNKEKHKVRLFDKAVETYLICLNCQFIWTTEDLIDEE